MSKKQEKLIVIDGHALLHRAFHALPPLTTKDGQVVNAVYGFTSILLKIIKEYQPDYLACTFDLAAPTFRHQEFVEYKAQRVKAPDEFYQQIPLTHEVLQAFNIPIYTAEGFEADDVIGSLVTRINKERPDIYCLIVTGDLDTLQLVNKQTEIFTIKRGLGDTIVYDITTIKERFGFGPEKMVDYKALRGDPSDNIPGVKGIGEKTAMELIKNFGSIDNIYQKIDKTDKISPRYKELLKNQEEQARQSYHLSTIVTDLPLPFSLTEMKMTGFEARRVFDLFQKLEFKSLLTKIPNAMSKHSAVPQEIVTNSIDKDVQYQLINTDKEWQKFINDLQQQKIFCLDTETTDLDTRRARLLGVSFCWQAGTAYYVNFGDHPQWLKEVSKILADEQIKKVGHNLKYDMQILELAGAPVKGLFFDTLIAAYLLFPPARSLKLDDLVFSELGHKMQPITDLIGPRGKKQINMADVDLAKITYYSAEDADYSWRLYEKLKKDLIDGPLAKLFKEMEMPLITVLSNMELTGIMVDQKFYSELSKQFAKKITDLEKNIYQLAGREFNVASPLQLKKVLFEDLKISVKGLKKTKTGVSTAAGELEKMRGLHPIIDYIEDFREYSKLKNTYLDALPELIDPQSGRVHTSFNQAVTATGRLSSSDPNLQNIPIRTELGRQLRSGFIARSGFKLLSADYSQIELRVVASLAPDEKMLVSFQKKEDIHTRTAAEIFKVPMEQVSFEQRRQAKEVNFGIIYGLGSLGLSQRTGISRPEAKEFIEKYLGLYNGIQKYLEKTKQQAHELGYVETLFGRRRYLPDINSHISYIQAGAERMAINMPIQGTAADLMKMAMLAVAKELSAVSKDSKMLLQVHDELVIEVPEKDVEIVAKFLKEAMENVCVLPAPIVVDIKFGINWGEMEKIEL